MKFFIKSKKDKTVSNDNAGHIKGQTIKMMVITISSVIFFVITSTW